MRTIDADVVIVGAGVVGCAIAARLSLDLLTLVVLERRHDVAEETSKSNTGVADSGWECDADSLEADLVTRSSGRWEELSERFDTPFRRSGALCVARGEDEAARLSEIERAAANNGVMTRRLDAKQVHDLAPYGSESISAAVQIPQEGIVDPIRLTLGYAELAVRNGAQFFFNEPLIGARRSGRRVAEVHTPTLTVRPRFIVNAAGLGADVVSRCLGGEDFRIWPRRGEYLLLDREVGRRIGMPVTQPPKPHTRGVMVVPAVHGALLLGPTADDAEDKTDRSTHADVLGRIFSECRDLVPELEREHVIKSFTGLRPASDETYRIHVSAMTDNVVQACAIRSTGVSGSPGIADHVRDLLRDAGLDVPERRDAIDRIPKRPRLAEELDCARLAQDPLGRTVICACEKVTALEIHDALRSPLPAKSIAGIAKRTRATWGRCQGAACFSGVSFIASLYLPKEAWALPVGEPAATLGVAPARHA